MALAAYNNGTAAHALSGGAPAFANGAGFDISAAYANAIDDPFGFDDDGSDAAIGTKPLLSARLPAPTGGHAGDADPASGPTSYTDLYASLSSLCPGQEQTAICLCCGAVINAGGKGCVRERHRRRI